MVVESQISDYKETFDINAEYLNEEDNSITILGRNDNPDWVFHSGPNYHTKYLDSNLTIAIISAAIGAIVPSASARVIAVIASVYFAARSEVIYAKSYTYKDANRPKLMPSFKAVTSFYYDRHYSDPLGSEYDVIRYSKR